MTVPQAVATALAAGLPDLIAGDPVDRGRAGLLVAVSGGADSMALLHALCHPTNRESFHICAAHFDHALRSAVEHEADLVAVRDACGKLSVPLLVGRAGSGEIRDLALREKSGIEAAARTVRYRFLQRAAEQTGARYLCTGHTEDDQVETVLMALGRGVSQLALSGIPAQRDLSESLTLLRPLLRVQRAQIESYLHESGVSWSEDRTNDDPGYERNRARHQLVPRLQSDLPEFRQTILALQQSSQKVRHAAEREAEDLRWQTDEEASLDASWIDARRFLAASRAGRLMSLFSEARRRGMIRPSSRIPVRFFAPLLDPTLRKGTVVEGRGSTICHESDRLVWSSVIVRPTDYGYLRSVAFGVPVELPVGPTLTVYPGEKETTDEQLSVIELKEVREPLIIRSHRIGDQILTAGGHKSVVSLLAELGVPRRGRCNVPVICDRDGVLALVGAGFGSDRNIVARRKPSGRGQSLVVVREDKTDVRQS